MRRWMSLWLLAVALPAVAAPIIGDITFDRRPDGVSLANSALEVSLDARTGTLASITDRASGRTVLSASGPVPWAVGDQPAEVRLLGVRTRMDTDAVVMEVDQEAAGWTATTSYRIWLRRPVLQRDLAIRPQADGDKYVTAVRLTLDGVGVGGAQDCRYSVLDNWPPRIVAFPELSPGRQVSDTFGGMSGHFVVTHSAEAALGLVAMMACETESAGARVTEQTASIRIEHTINATFLPRAGKTERFGSQLLAVTHGDWRASLRQGRELFRLVGLVPPRETQDLANRAIIYSAHPGGTIDSGFRDVGGFKGLTDYLPQLQRLGVNVLWLLPTWKGPVYAPVDYYSLDPRLGTEADLKALVDSAHQLGIRVLGDLIPHGPREESGLAKEHRDWVCSNEDGSIKYWWGCLYCDYAHPGWQQYMGDHAADWVKRVGLDGYRVDCAGGGPTNWRPFGDNRPSMSGTYGGTQVLRAAREAMEREKRDVLLLAEVGGPQFLRHANMMYDWPLCLQVLRNYPQQRPEEFVPQLAQWLDNEQYWLPPGALPLHFLENHDTVRARMVYGPGPERALMALCALIPGTPMVYHLQESGLAPYLERLYALRRNVPALHSGEGDFLTVACDRPAVLTVLRSLGNQRVLGAVNLSGDAQACILRIPAGTAAWGRGVRNALQSPDAPMPQVETAAGGDCIIRLTLAPFEAAALLPAEFSAPGSATASQVTAPLPAASPLRASRQGGDVVVEGSGLKLTVGGGNGLLKSAEYAGAAVLSCRGFGEGSRRLWLGARRIALESATEATVEAGAAGAEGLPVHSHGAITDAAGNVAAEYAVSYTVALRDGRPRLAVGYEVTARQPVENVLGALVELLALDPSATEWAVGTVEGCLHDRTEPRWPADRRYEGRYLRGVGDRVWALQDQLAGLPAQVAVKGANGLWTVLRLGEGARLPDNAMLKLRHGEETAPFVQLEWLDGNAPVNLKAGETLKLGYVVDFGPPGELPAGLTQAGRLDLAGGWMRVTGSQVEVQNQGCYLRASRYGGGRINTVAEGVDAPPIVRGSRAYTDWGIYPDEITPDGRQVHNMVTTDSDPETWGRANLDTTGPVLSFGGYLRDSDGRSTPAPRTAYRATYTVGAEAIGVKLQVRPMMALTGASAFLAQTLGIPAFSKYTVAARDGTVTRDATGTGRLWESKVAGFGTDPWMEWRGPDGRGARISGADLAGLQNAFLLRSGSGEGTAFLAFLDGLPTDLLPQWRTLSYTLTPLKGGQ
jgi:glycosidase